MAKKKSGVGGERHDRIASCSFCRKSYRDVGPLVEAPGDVSICGECVELCQSIIDQEKRRRGLSRERAGPELTAGDLGARLAHFLRGQEETAQALAAVGHRHFEHLAREQDAPEGQVSAVLLVGPARSGRVFAARCLAHVLGAPFVAVNQGTLAGAAPAGFEGESLLFYALLTGVDFDVDAAQRGLVYVDGIDRPGVAQLLQERLAQAAGSPLARRLNFDATRPLFLLGGTFEGLDRVMAHRGRHPEQPVSTEDLRACGMPLDFVGRVRAIVRVAPLDEEAVARVVSCADLARWPEGG
jgi:ATP-dependent Clp protease ATP-binding subunit ClpX